MKYLGTVVVGVHRVEGFQHLEVLESFPQGVRARGFLKDSELGNFRRI